MDGQESVTIAEWTARSKKMIEETRGLLERIGFDVSGLPRAAFDGEKPLSLVFAGQYSAGKSSVLKALTGIEDIVIGAGITTQEAHSYDWNGIEVVDTPGIHTTLRPDHDEISYRAITNADMLAYVVTHELFDGFIGQDFRRLLIDEDKAGEMILIVNKMADIGNTAENRDIKLKDLEKPTYPYTPAQLRTVFIDAESWLDSLSEPDAEIAEALRNRSNYTGLLSTIDSFVGDKAVSSRLTTALYRLFDILQKALLEYQPRSGDSDIDALEEQLRQERLIILETQLRIEAAVKAIFQEAASQIREKGRDVANTVSYCDNEAELNETFAAARDEVDAITGACADDINSRIEELTEDCRAQLDDFHGSDFSRSLKLRIEDKQAKGNTLINRLFRYDDSTKGRNKMIANTAGTKVAAGGFKAVKGSNIHRMIFDSGQFFGPGFKPLEVFKFIRNIDVAGKALGAVGFVLSIGIQVKADVDADKREREMRKVRETIRGDFNAAADEVAAHFSRALGSFLVKNYRPRIDEIDAGITRIRDGRSGKSETCKLLERAQEGCRALIAEIHQSYEDGFR